MSPLYCLLHSDDDNFKAQVLFMGGGGGGRMEAVWEGPELLGWVSALCVGRPVVCLGPPPIYDPYRSSRGKLGTPISFYLTPTLKSHGPILLQVSPPNPSPHFKAWGQDLKRASSGSSFWSLPISVNADVSSCLHLVFPAAEALDHQLSTFVLRTLLWAL